VNNEQREILTVNREVDFSFEFESKARFRVNAYFQKGTLAASLRLIPFEIRSIEELGLPKICHTFAKLRQGFILYTGPTGCGKSTTIAAIVNEINQERQEHIVTIEDPIEFIFPKGKSLVSQRGLHSDTHSWDIALRSILREDPNIVFIGEMRDYETISSALTIAETGHLVFATLHTNSAAQSIDRIVDVFPEHAKGQVRMQLSLTLEAVVSQRLLPSLDRGRVVATEIMIATPAVRNSIREGKTHMLDNIIQTSGELGMMTFEASLASLVREGKVSREIAEEYALRPDELARQLRGK
jgi:twitching motility protein PilT